MKGLAYYLSPVGELLIKSENEKIITLAFLKDSKQEEILSPVIEQCKSELEEYFSGHRKFFSFEMDLWGTDFQIKVWNELVNIPFGKTISYEALAIRVGNIKSIRAVGLANGQNPIAIVVPCHRVIGKGGELVGYGGGLDKKIWLLQHEGAMQKQLSIF
ncbi:MAG: methylated-DNA--[protein]-cysteine S-methyltransferase [Bacteroidetes bacterium]|nr:methylated-DNA--[protein]-cysteine S-methyltransferase [Bacteroidota bacterium]MBI3482750.1 methylated-DNA--[protein]-cysteine S-methyltransferase [Bacteroidota bacterium]